MIEIGRVQIEFLARRIARGVQDHVERFATGERDRVRKVSHVVASHIAQQPCVEANHTHRNAERGQRLVLSHVQVRDAQQCATTGRNIDDARQGLRRVQRAVGRLRYHRSWCHRVWVAAAIQQEVLVLHVREGFRIEGHADEVEIRIEAVDLDRILHVVTRGTVAVVVGELRSRGDIYARGRRGRRLSGAQDIGTGDAVGARVSHRIRVTDLETLQQLRGRRASRRHAILPRPYVDLADHAHLQMLGWGDMAVPEVSSSIWRQVVVGEAAADIDRDGGIRHTVVEGRSVGVTVEVHRVLLEQVRTHDLADVGEREEEFVVLVYGHQRRRLVGVHHTDVHDQPRIDMSGQGAGSWLRLRVRDQADRTVEVVRRNVEGGLVYRSTDEYRVDAAGVVDVEFGLHVGTGQTAGHLFEARQWTKAEQVGLRSVAHGRKAVAA